MATYVLLLASCATPTPQPPKITGAVGSVTQKDIQQAIALVEQTMRHESGRDGCRHTEYCKAEPVREFCRRVWLSISGTLKVKA